MFGLGIWWAGSEVEIGWFVDPLQQRTDVTARRPFRTVASLQQQDSFKVGQMHQAAGGRLLLRVVRT